MIKVQNLSYEYPSFRALNDVSFEIEKGSITALVGPNGSGKTTLLKCLASLEKPFSGKVTLSNYDTVDNPLDCRKITGFQYDFFGLYDQLTVAQSFQFYARSYRVPPDLIPKRIQKVAEQLNLVELLNKKNSHLSRGQRQRVAIGQAILHMPQILLLDEPASGLDPEARHALSELLLDINKSEVTILVSSHILAELDQYADNILILKEGRVIESDSTLNTQSNNYVKLFIGTEKPEENLIEFLKSKDDITDIFPVLHGYEVNIVNNRENHSLLLKEIVLKDFSIHEFKIKESSIQDQYLEAVNQ